MDTTELLEILNGIFRKVLKRDDITLTESTTAHDVDGWDSLTNMVLITEIENKFGVRFSFHEIVKLKNVGDLAIPSRIKPNRIGGKSNVIHFL